MLNGLWLSLILLSVVLGGLTGRLEAVTNGAFSAARDAVTVVALPMAGLMSLWLGLLRLAELSGLVAALARGLHPVMRILFPEVPAGHPAMGDMVLNMAANMLGLGNAATPLGLRAMRSLESLNPHPGIATNAMCTFLAINTSSIQLIPSTAIAILATQGSQQPTAVVATALLASATAAIVGILTVKSLQRLPLFRVPSEEFSNATAAIPSPDSQRVPEEPCIPSTPPLSRAAKTLIGAYCAFFLLLATLMLAPDWFTRTLEWLRQCNTVFASVSLPALPEALRSQAGLPKFLGVLSLLAVPFVTGFFCLFAAVRSIKVYEEFVLGAKEGCQVALRIVPYLTAILVGVRMFREAGGVELLAQGLAPILGPLGVPADLLPLILVRPLSGGATTGLFTELVVRFGADSLIARTAATIYGSTETTFYVLAVYFGSVGIRKGRHALATGLVADAAGAIASIAICRWLFG